MGIRYLSMAQNGELRDLPGGFMRKKSLGNGGDLMGALE